MSNARVMRLAVAVAATVLGPTACLAADEANMGTLVEAGGAGSGAAGAGSPGSSGSSSGGPADPGCEGPLGPPRDPAGLPACCPTHGGAHCVAEVPADMKAMVAACASGGFCVPDAFIATGGVFQPAQCSSIDGAPGVCLSLCIPEVEKVAALLPQGPCAASERCVPCISPLDNKPTGACDAGFSCGDPLPGSDDPGGGSGGADPGADPDKCPHEGPPVLDPAAFPACPECGGGHCLDKQLVPADFQDQLAACDGKSLCVPDAFIESGGNFIAQSCTSMGGLEGRCLSTCLPEIAAQASKLPQDNCPNGQRCAPCYGPFDGAPTGACSLSCDPGPSSPAPQPAPKCCHDLGYCVLPSVLPADKVEYFDDDDCPDDPEGLLCVPEIFTQGPYQPQSCTTSSYGPGGCLPDCLAPVDHLAFFGILKQDGCPEHFVCAPCVDPMSNQPSGACEPQ
ncbi:MAG: hypothetical protein HY744_18840 [Deltaproteobacteria bacterium]|nr:hypothetical protein [Deltaproteobacteria bacterium]